MTLNERMEGKKTYTGIALFATGALMQVLGLDESSASEIVNQAIQIISMSLELVGTVLGYYGRKVAKVSKS